MAPLRKLSTALACQNLHRETESFSKGIKSKTRDTYWEILLKKGEERLFDSLNVSIFISWVTIFALHDAHLNDESGGSLFMTVRILVRRPFFPSHTRLLSVLTRASTSGMLAFMDMALSSFSSWLFSRRYLFLKDGNNLNNRYNLQDIVRSKGTKWVTYSWWSLKLWSSLRNWILKDISCTMKMLISVNCCVKGSLMA